MNQVAFQDELVSAKEKLAVELESLVNLRPLPAVAMRINGACTNQDFDTVELTKLVECDPAITTKILSVVNSSIYGYSREVSSIKQALVMLGRRSLSELSIAIAAEAVFSSGDSGAGARKQLYEHSLGCASVARMLAENIESDVDSGTAFLAGMLHDIGKLTLLDVAPNVYVPMLEQCSIGVSDIVEENNAFGTDHTLIGIVFGNVWGLSAPIREAIKNHHVEPDFEEMSVTQVTMLANRLARNWGIGQDPCESSCEATQRWLEETGLVGSEEIREQAFSHFKELKTLLAG